MINSKSLVNYLDSIGITFYAGVPDSVMEPFCTYLDKHKLDKSHIIASNEGSAIGLAVGNYLSTGNLPVVYMQNSGFGNAFNPLTSITNRSAYSIPILLFIGWRGSPGESDEPQHELMGDIIIDLLNLLDIKYEILSNNLTEGVQQIQKLYDLASSNLCPVSLLIRKGTFEKDTNNSFDSIYEISRESAIGVLMKGLPDYFFVSTTGKCSREVFEFRVSNNQTHNKNFYCVGAMGHASAIAMGIAMNNPSRKVCVLDGDGAVLMQMGVLTTLGCGQLQNLLHVVLNNGAHESVGGQRTLGFSVDLAAIAKGCGYKNVYTVTVFQDLIALIPLIRGINESCFIEIRIDNFSREDLIRPTKTLIQLKKELMGSLLDSNL
ncbi:phosphoenolpyruvate decarboxylase [Pedobacter cryoconitis]|uniref:Phosphoenolpyruvate decarboxylase n=1 Tax=Pedobacter cryoconitis TaxID=188932 RepID=A0A127V807_9SPHI|nr:phosphonopyruvate decarboxylase [Pedobacter cryoconitis]AMP97390.1 phosphoenolpyruvate decarboxylase [Pedobacter cryoconitis]